MLVNCIATGVAVLAAVLSGVCYRHSGRKYAEGKTDAISSPGGFRWVYRYLQLSTILVAVVAQWSDHAALLKAFHSDWVSVSGSVFALAGLAVFIWAKVSLSAAYSPCFDSLVPLAIVIVGPYRWVRHPIYSGNVILLLGLFLASGSLWLALNTVILAVYYSRAAVIEEQVLGSRFPDYVTLVARTGRFLPVTIPRGSALTP